MSKTFVITVLLAVAVVDTFASDLRLTDQITTDVPISGVSTTPDGRTFLLYARVDGSRGPSVVELVNETTIPYPNADWDSYTQGQDVATHFVHINSQRIGPDGDLYIVDTGSPAFGEPVLENAVKLIQVNLTTNNVSRVYYLDNVTCPLSLLDDVRFNGPVAYLTDGGVPGLIVLDRATGSARRALNDTSSTRGFMPMSSEGNLLRSPTGGFEYIYTDQLEVSPDGMYLYYQAASGGMYRIQTTYLNNASLADTQLESLAEPYALTPATGGTAIDANGTIYVSDVNFQRIIRIALNGTMSVFIEDPRLLWVDAMWIDRQNRLWMPAAQLNRGTPLNNGTSLVQKPLHIYTIDIGIGPPANDHA